MMRLSGRLQWTGRSDLFWASGLATLCLAGLLWPHGSPVRATAGLLFTLLVPGLALLIAVGPSHLRLSPLERSLLAPCLSLAIVAVVGLGLNATPLGLRTDVVIAVLAALSALCLGIAAFTGSRNGTAISTPALAVVILALTGAALIVQLPTTPHLGQPAQATSLALTTPAGELPTNAVATVGISYPLIAEVRNGDGGTDRYRLLARFDERTVVDVMTPALSKGQKWSTPLAVPITRPGDGQQLVAELYRVGQPQPLRSTSLEIRVGG